MTVSSLKFVAATVRCFIHPKTSNFFRSSCSKQRQYRYIEGASYFSHTSSLLTEVHVRPQNIIQSIFNSSILLYLKFSMSAEKGLKWIKKKLMTSVSIWRWGCAWREMRTNPFPRILPRPFLFSRRSTESRPSDSGGTLISRNEAHLHINKVERWGRSVRDS